jgi:lipopolysaccharide export system permease protein
VVFTASERYPWELWQAPSNSPQQADQRAQFMAELHSRIAAPLYPLAFLVLTFAYLGAPRTNRQSRAMSMISAIVAVAALRAIGFIGAIAGAKNPAAIVFTYLSIVVAFILGGWGIARGVIIEPPAFIGNLVAALSEALRRRIPQRVGQAR